MYGAYRVSDCHVLVHGLGGVSNGATVGGGGRGGRRGVLDRGATVGGGDGGVWLRLCSWCRVGGCTPPGQGLGEHSSKLSRELGLLAHKGGKVVRATVDGRVGLTEQRHDGAGLVVQELLEVTVVDGKVSHTTSILSCGHLLNHQAHVVEGHRGGH